MISVREPEAAGGTVSAGRKASVSAAQPSRTVYEGDYARVIVRDMLPPDRAIDDFLDDCRRRGYSERTLTTYRRILDEFSARLPLDADVKDISEDDVRRYLGSKGSKARGTIAHAESVMSSWLTWMYRNRKIGKNPMDRMDRTKRIPAADLDVTSVSTDDARRLLEAATSWTERLTVGVLLYMGPRRRAVARLRVKDYDPANGLLKFREKGGKVISKPVPGELRALLDEALADGVLHERAKFLHPSDTKDGPYLVPPEAYLTRGGERDDRCIYDTVKRVAKAAGVDAHVHALRATFAVFFLETHQRDAVALQELLGHRSSETTKAYVRKMDKGKAMDTVRDLSWAVAKPDAKAGQARAV